ncbi:MAG: M23 family metallopeptidase [Clostridiales bacterium]|nr:M23 family metallopeptidase [Clostridiales bacterium]
MSKARNKKKNPGGRSAAGNINAKRVAPSVRKRVLIDDGDDVFSFGGMFDEVFDISDEDENDDFDVARLHESTLQSKGIRRGDTISVRPVETKSVFGMIYIFIYALGLQSMRYTRHFTHLLGKKLRYPLRVMGVLLRGAWLAVDRLYFKSLHTIVSELALFKLEIKAANENIRSNVKKTPASLAKVLTRYIRNTFSVHGQMFRIITNTLLPIVMIAILVMTVGHWANTTMAIHITYNGNSLGYVSDESVYLDALSLAKARLHIDAQDSTAPEFSTPVYEMVKVNPNQLSDPAAVCDRIIDNTEGNYTNACGIYIDGEFICAIKNETDAISVFNGLLAKYDLPEEDENAMIGFVEDIEYIQGLYQDDTDSGGQIMWDANKLTKKISGTKTDAKYYIAEENDSLSKIARKNDMLLSELKALNPDAGRHVHPGDKFLIANEVSYLQVKVVKTEIRTEPVNYGTVRTANANMYRGTENVIRQGRDGTDRITELVTYVDGVKVSTEQVSKVRISNPVDEKVEYGTKSVSGNSSSKGGSDKYSISVSKSGWVWPAPGCRTVSSGFGNRGSGFHKGVDLTTSGAKGKPVVAAKSGKVDTVLINHSAYGNCVIIDHGNGVKTRYAHMLSNSVTVRTGQKVSAGQQIGKVGSTGNSTGPHLHFEIIINGNYTNPLNYIK